MDDKNVELDYELPVALANATEGAARSTVLEVTQVEPSHDTAKAQQPTFATFKRCTDAKELKEKPKAWSLKVVEYEHQFKVIDEAKKTIMVREMMPKGIKQAFLTGSEKVRRNHGETGDQHQRNDDRRRTGAKGPGRRRHRVIWTPATACRVMMRVRSRGKCTKLTQEQSRKDHTIPAKMITEMRGADIIVFRINSHGIIRHLMRF